MRTASDERLAALVHRGDDEAFETLYARYREPLLRYCRSILRNAEDAVDAEQNAAVSAYRALRLQPPTGRVKPWLYRIAHNEAISVMRRRREHEELNDELPSAAGQPQDRVADWELLVRDLRSLPEAQRASLLLRELAGLEYDEIGTTLAITPVAARKSVFEARSALHETAAGRSVACEEIRLTISSRDGRALRGRRVRGHLDDCASCAMFAQAMTDRRRVLATIPVAPTTALGLVGAGAAGVAGTGAGGLTGAGGTAGLLGGSASAIGLKGITSLCAVCAVAGTTALISSHHGTAHRAAPVPHHIRHIRHHAVAHAEHRSLAAHAAGSGHRHAMHTSAAASAAPAVVHVHHQRPTVTGATPAATTLHRLSRTAAQPASGGAGVTSGSSGSGSTVGSGSTTGSGAASNSGSASGSGATTGSGTVVTTGGPTLGTTQAPTATAGGGAAASSPADGPALRLLDQLLNQAQTIAAPGLQIAEANAQAALNMSSASLSLLQKATTGLASALLKATGLGTASAAGAVVTGTSGAAGTAATDSAGSTSGSATGSATTNPLALLIEKILKIS